MRISPSLSAGLIFSCPWLRDLLRFTLWPHGAAGTQWAAASSPGDTEGESGVVKGRLQGKVPSLSPDSLFGRQPGVCDSANNVGNQQPGQKAGEEVFLVWSIFVQALLPFNNLNLMKTET